MQREIKFRVWCTLEEQMGPELTLVEMISQGLRHDEDVDVFLQFTGLHDKNGKPIYEGDVVTLVHRECEGNGWYSDSRERGVVCFDPNWGVKFDCRDHTQRVAPWSLDKCEKHWSDHSMPRDYRNVTVLGNIYEHPELLSPKVTNQSSPQ